MNAPQVRERGILFSSPMVRAILAGRKTQTRRVMHNQPRWCSSNQGGYWWYGHPKNGPGDAVVDWSVVLDDAHLRVIGTKGRGWGAHAGCPHGDPGDRLWVRETHAPRYCDDGRPGYRADWTAPDGVPEPTWTPSLLMRRTDSRITLDILNIRVERAHDISDADIAAEGVDAEAVQSLWDDPKNRRRWGQVQLPGRFPDFAGRTPRELWSTAWTLINGRASWDANPWTWVIEFRRTP